MVTVSKRIFRGLVYTLRQTLGSFWGRAVFRPHTLDYPVFTHNDTYTDTDP